jgi:hypothetical protein
MATEVAPGVEINMWTYNISKKLIEAKKHLEFMYKHVPRELLTFSIVHCNKEIWDYEEDTSLNLVHYFFNCNDVILQLILVYYSGGKVESKDQLA